MNKILILALGVFVIFSVIASYGYYVSSVLSSQVSYNYQGVCTQYTYKYNYTGFTNVPNPIYNASKCSSLELQSAAAGASEGVLIILILVDIAFMVLYYLFEVREINIRQSKK